MEKKLKCTLQLSLKELSVRKVTTILWTDVDIFSDITSFRKECRNKLEEKVELKVAKLELPEQLTKQVIDRIHPIGLQIKKWKDCHEEYLFNMFNPAIGIGLTYLEKLCWTNMGTIDYGKTAEKIVLCDEVEVVRRYKLACLYCLEDYILLLWKDIPREMKGYFYNKKENPPYLHSCWPHIILGELDKLDFLWKTSGKNLTSFNQFAFEYSAEIGNKVAAEYFYQKLTFEERETSLVRTATAVAVKGTPESFHNRIFPRQSFSEVFCYLLTLLTPSQQMEVCKEQPVAVLLSFYTWPWQDLFLENANLLWEFLPVSKYDCQVMRMAKCFGHSEYRFSELFQEFFLRSPPEFKRHFSTPRSENGSIPACCYIYTFFSTEDAETIRVIFRSLEHADRLKIVFHRDVLQLFYMSVLKERWRMLEAVILEASMSQEEKERFKTTFKDFLIHMGGGLISYEHPHLERFYKLLD